MSLSTAIACSATAIFGRWAWAEKCRGRHTLLTMQTLGAWRTPAMVQRYAHLVPDHLARAVERLVAARAVGLRRDLDSTQPTTTSRRREESCNVVESLS